jgi:hypothetical protein
MGSRVVPGRADLVRSVRQLAARVRRLEARAAYATAPVAFCPFDVSQGVPVAGGDFVACYAAAVPRGTEKGLWVWVLCGNGADAVVEVRLACDWYPAVGEAVASAAGGRQWVRVGMEVPEGWPLGEFAPVMVQARRVSAADAATVQVSTAYRW